LNDTEKLSQFGQMSENVNWWVLLRQILILIWDKWPNYLSK